MRTTRHSAHRTCRLALTPLVGAVAVILGGVAGCGKKETLASQAPSTPETTAAVKDTTAAAEGWLEMESLEAGKWEAIEGATELAWDDGSRVMQIGVGTNLNGVRWTGPVPTVPYTVELEARRLSGSDFFCGLTFPVRSGSESVTLIVGGWGGSVVGISSIDGLDASENLTGTQHEFENHRWYRIRVEVGEERLQAWIDDREMFDVDTEGLKLSLRPGAIEDCSPFGLATWLTIAEVRGVRWRQAGN